MNQLTPRIPERLRTGGATELERRILHSAAGEQPSRELSEGMAAALGIATPLLLAAPQPTLSAGAASAKVTALNARALVPWISGAIVALAIGGAVLALRGSTRSVPLAAPGMASSPVSAPAPLAPTTAVAAPDQRATNHESSD
jgi:hypothetical protein